MNIFPSQTTLSQNQQKALKLLGLAGALFLILQLVWSLFLDPYVGDKIKSSFRLSTRHAYVLEFDDVDLGLLGRSITFQNLAIYPDSSRLDSSRVWEKVSLRGSLQTEELSINGIGLLDLIYDRKLGIRRIGMKAAVIKMEYLGSRDDDAGQNRQSLNRLIYKAVNTRLKSLAIGETSITNASLKIESPGNEFGNLTIDHFSLLLNDITVDSVSAQRDHFFLTDKVEVTGRELSWSLSGDLYTLKAHAAGASTLASSAFADSLRLEPHYPKYEFSKKVGREIDRVELSIARMAMKRIRFDSLLHRRKLLAGRFDIENATLNVLHDKRLPGGPPETKPLPHLAFRQWETPVRIDTVTVRDSFISYSEHKPQASKAGKVTFENLQATIFGLSNFGDAGNAIEMEAQAHVMGDGLLKARFAFPKNDTTGYHTVYGSLGSMPFASLNPILENVGFVQAGDGGKIHGMDFSMELDGRNSKGTMVLNYEGLNVRMLEKDSAKEGETRKLTSFIANTFVIKKNNHKEPLRQGEIAFERDREKSVFNYWWKSLLSGMKDTIGL